MILLQSMDSAIQVSAPMNFKKPVFVRSLICGSDSVRSAARGLPMIVANPDYVTVEENVFHIMPGTLAAKYEELGGEVKWMGKPHKMIYESAMGIAGVNPAEAIAVRDSLHHDIKGANVSGLESVFITGGIHGSELGLTSLDETASLDSVKTLTTKHNAFPPYVLSAFKW